MWLPQLMTWREFWQNALAGVRAWFSLPPRAVSQPAAHSRQVQAPRALPGPVGLHTHIVQTLPTLDAAAPDDVTLSPPAPLENAGVASGDDSADDPGASLPDGEQDYLALLESLLFVAAEPVEPARLAQALDLEPETVIALLDRLAQTLSLPGRGVRLQQFDGKVQLVSAPQAAAVIERFLNLDTGNRLSGPALETLAVIAYRQPVTRAQIEAVRGVDCAGVLRSLTQRGLITEVGRQETVGRPILYGVTETFLQQFGLLALSDLPPLEEGDADRLWAATEHSATPAQPS